MKMRISVSTAVVLASLGAVALTSQAPASTTTMLGAAQAFLETLGPDEKATAMIPFGDAERQVWFYTPVDRKGLTLKAMNEAQRDAAMALLRAGFSENGYDKAETIRQLETVLFAIEGRAMRDTGLYYFTIFGDPSETGTWGWRYEGHHVSQHWTIVDGEATATTPQFFGANPADVRDGPMRGTRVLGAEEDLGRAFVKSLNAAQLADAIIGNEAPADILTTNDREATMQDNVGIAYTDLSADQQEALAAIVHEYADAQPGDVALARLERLRAAGIDRVKFAWMGGTEKGEGHYYRIQGPTFLIEYDNTQNDGNHIHSVWRDFDGDFGEDLLAAHYRAHPHQVHAPEK